jgi:hypothetical protein
MRNHSDINKYSKTDKILTFNSEREKNKSFDEYYEKVADFSEESTFKKDFMDDCFKRT